MSANMFGFSASGIPVSTDWHQRQILHLILLEAGTGKNISATVCWPARWPDVATSAVMLEQKGCSQRPTSQGPAAFPKPTSQFKPPTASELHLKNTKQL